MGLKDPRKISVRDLIAYTHLQGDLFSESQSNRRALEGTKGHKAVQDARGDDYEREVKVSGEFDSDDLKLIVDGRMDGLFPSIPLIEEIKTVLKAEDYPRDWDDSPEEHRLQLLSYAWLYCEEQSIDSVNVQLTYYNLMEGTERVFPRSVSKEESYEVLLNLTSTYFFLWQQSLERNHRRNQSIREASFPYGEFRGPQREMSVALYRAVREKEILMVEAPTGTGKTMGALFPAFKALSENLGDRIFYVTARTPGRLAAEEAYRDLLKAGMKCRAVSITAKQKICFLPESKCHPDECPYTVSYYDKLAVLLENLEEDMLFDREIIEELAKEHMMCPFEVSLDISLVSDLLICDYNYVFDPLVKLKRYFQVKRGEEYILLTDESHNLPDRARDMFSAHLSKKKILEVKRENKDRYPLICKKLERINKILLNELKTLREKNRKWDESEKLPEKLSATLLDFLNEAEWSDASPDIIELSFELRRFYMIGELAGDEHTILKRQAGNSGLILSILNMDPAPLLAKCFKSFRSSILFSATLIPSAYFTKTLFGDREVLFQTLPSPFPGENCLICIRSDIETRYNKREESLEDLCQSIYEASISHKGNYLVFFPSYAYMELVAGYFAEHYPDLAIHIQESGMSEESRQDYLDKFAADDSEGLLAFALMGGIFGEGIDLKGEKLIGVIIVGPGLPGISVERDLYKKYYEERGDNGFDFAYRLPGFNKVVQAAGRVIRSEEDKGTILLIDNRYSWRDMKALFPPYWENVRYCRQKEQMQNTLSEFWSECRDENREI